MPSVLVRVVRVAAVIAEVVALGGCSASSLTGADAGTVTLQSVQITGCPTSASPLPGWVNCTATVSLTVTTTVTSGYVSVYFNYPNSASFYHGQLQVSSRTPGSIVVPVVNDYVPSCVTSYATTVDVYDGPQSASSAPLLASFPLTLNVKC
jgi:hypothetical protein